MQPGYYDQPERHPQKRPAHRWPWVIGIVTLAVLLLCGGLTTFGLMGEDAGQPQPSRNAQRTPDPGTRPTSKKAVAKQSGVGAGMWEVGKDIRPGKYRTDGMAKDSVLCYWHSAPDTGTDHITEQGLSSDNGEPGIITLKTGQYFKTSGCQDWIRQPR